MKKNIYSLIVLTMLLVACKKEDLSLPNPNQPTLVSLTSEAGIKSFALGIYEKFTGWANNDLPGGGTSGFMAAIGFHSEMGDDMFCPYGNWGTRWTAQIKSITLPNNTVVLGSNTTTLSQKEQLQAFNSRQAGETNVFQYEWYSMYLTISTSNALLQALDNPALKISETKKKTLKAWALWWKGMAYSRIGSIYLAGIITDEPATGITNGDFKSRDIVLAEGNENFDEALAILAELTQNADYDNIMTAIVPTFAGSNKIVNPQMWTRIINTYKARNLLVNKKVKDMTATDWNAVLTLANNGIQSGDNIFTLGQTTDGNRDVSGNFWHPFNLTNESSGFWFVSERLIQEYKNGDARKDKSFILWADQGQADIVNLRGRGLLFGTRYNYVYIEDGGSFSSLNGNLGQWPISPTYE
jgi:starch-binding outer membrane protein, SusD/RagB family